MDITTFLILALATWRISSLLVDEDGPGDFFTGLRAFVGVEFDERSNRVATNSIAGAFVCVWCMSFWVGLVIAVAYLIIPEHTTWVCLPLALSAGAVVVKEMDTCP